MFDSGVGGLTVLHECLVWLPHEDFVYLGDTARFPYGGRPPAELREMAVEIGSYLVEEERAKLVVVACNSAAAAGLPRIAEATGIAVVGVIAPAARQALRATTNRRVGVLATPATVESGAYERAIRDVEAEVHVESVACPKLAPLIQEGGALDPSVIDLVDEYCEPLREAEVDTAILGCTHYPIVRPVLQRALGRAVTLISSGQAIADEVERELAARGLDNDIGRRGDYRFLCTGDPEAFRSVAARSLGLPVEDVRRVDLSAAAVGAS
ncbi:MAG: glutamate racemase [Thermoleophilaceae bacterium]|nr:glutamate racemase [Thermoleophilaceae bacterium]